MDDLVPVPDDLLSDDSDFHGGEETKALYNQLTDSYNPEKYWSIHDWNIQVIAAKGKKKLDKAGKLRPNQETRMQDEMNVKAIKQDPRETSPKKDEDGDVSMDLEGTTLTTSSSTKDLVDKPRNYYEGLFSAKQLDESVTEFLTRLPPSSTTSIRAQGAWIWICNPHPHYPAGSSETDGDIATFRQRGTRLLENYRTRKAEIQAENPEKAQGQITRLLRPNRQHLETDLRDLAIALKVTNGKWMLFPNEAHVDQIWSIVANAVWEGKLGTVAKIATASSASDNRAFDSSDEDVPNPTKRSDSRAQGQRLICIYTPSFTDVADITRVLRSIKDLGLINNEGLPIGSRGTAGSLKTIYYKCDAYTYLDISGGNEYGLKASIYSSREIVPEWYPEGSGRGRGRGGRTWRGS